MERRRTLSPCRQRGKRAILVEFVGVAERAQRPVGHGLGEDEVVPAEQVDMPVAEG